MLGVVTTASDSLESDENAITMTDMTVPESMTGKRLPP